MVASSVFQAINRRSNGTTPFMTAKLPPQLFAGGVGTPVVSTWYSTSTSSIAPSSEPGGAKAWERELASLRLAGLRPGTRTHVVPPSADNVNVASDDVTTESPTSILTSRIDNADASNTPAKESWIAPIAWPFTRYDVELLEGMASHAAIALRAVQQLDDMSRSRKTTAALLDIVQTTNSDTGATMEVGDFI